MNITKCRFFISFLSVSFRKVHSLYKNIQVYTSICFGWTHPLRDIFLLNYITEWHVFRSSHIGTLFISVDNRLHLTEKRYFRFVSQSTDFSFRFVPFRFAKYRFSISFRPISFRKVQIFHFVSSHFVSFHFVSSHFVSQSTISRPNTNPRLKADFRIFSAKVRACAHVFQPCPSTGNLVLRSLFTLNCEIW